MATDANKKEIILIQPPIAKSIHRDYISVQFPLGLGYIAKSLSLREVNVTINDFIVEQYNTTRFLVNSKLPYKRLYNLSADELLYWRNWLLKEYYTSWRYIFRQIFRVRSIKESKYLLRLAKSVVKNSRVRRY